MGKIAVEPSHFSARASGGRRSIWRSLARGHQQRWRCDPNAPHSTTRAGDQRRPRSRRRAVTTPSILRPYQTADRRRDRGERPHYTGAQRNPPAHIPHDWEDMTLNELGELFNRECPTPQATIEAIIYCVRERGVAALKEPSNVARLRTC